MTQITLLKKCQGHKRQRQIEELSQFGGDQVNVTVKCNVQVWIGFWRKKGCY